MSYFPLFSLVFPLPLSLLLTQPLSTSIHPYPTLFPRSHHDWGVSGHPQSRLITLLIYLTDQASPRAGGETAFPKGGEDGRGFKVRPQKGTAVLFYNLLEDGNGDDKALHAAMPCVEGEKMLANFWVWDDKFGA